MTGNYDRLLSAACDAAKNAYVPYSGFCVGAALVSADGRIFTGCNVENASYSVTVCAERNALFAAVAAGVRDFEAIAVLGRAAGAAEANDFTIPCGVCLQALAEFCDPERFVVLMMKNRNEYREVRLGKLLPYSFWLKPDMPRHEHGATE